MTLVTLPHAVPPEIRLRAFLKHALRTWKLRCVDIRMEDEVSTVKTKTKEPQVIDAPGNGTMVPVSNAAAVVLREQPSQETEPQAEPEHSKLTAALAAVRDRCRAAEKNAKNTFHRYNYADADEIVVTANEALEESGLALIPTCWELRVTGSSQFAVWSLYREYVLAHVSGESMSLVMKSWPVVEEKGRPLDKAFAIAMTSSRAHVLVDLLQIPRSDPAKNDMAGRDDRQAKPTPPATVPLSESVPSEPAQSVHMPEQPTHGGMSLAQPLMASQHERIDALVAELKLTPDDIANGLARWKVPSIAHLTVAQAGEVITALEKRQKNQAAAVQPQQPG